MLTKGVRGRTCRHTHENMLTLRRIHPRYLEVVWSLIPFLYLYPPSLHHFKPVFQRQVLECAALVCDALQKVAAVSQQRALNLRRHLWLLAIYYMPRRLVAHWLLGRVEKVPLNPFDFFFFPFQSGVQFFFAFICSVLFVTRNLHIVL